MSLPVRVEPEAARELVDAAIWYERQHDGLGREFLAAVDQSIERITRWPDAGTLLRGLSEDITVRQVPVARFPYRIAYLVTAEAIRILAFAHDRRRPSYWHPRTGK